MFDILKTWGWNSYFDSAYQREIAGDPIKSHWIPARVIGEERGFLRVASASVELKWAQFRGLEKNRPAVGDWILGSPMPGTDRMLLEEVFPRYSSITRREAGGELQSQIIGANIDLVFIVSSLNRDFNIKRIERYLALAIDGGVEPVVVLSKSDLANDVDSYVRQVHELRSDIEVFPVSLVSQEGLEKFASFLRPGETLALVGSSGVGKSSLVNFLLEENLQKTKEIGDDDKGKHATTGRMIFQLPRFKACILDTPGMREVGLWIDQESVSDLYTEIQNLSQSCRFRNCEHSSEPGCAVLKALQDGRLLSARYESYLKLRREAEFSARKSNPAEMSEARKKWKELSKSLRVRHKSKGKKK